MKRLRRIISTEDNYNTDIQFTLDDVCELLSQIEELKNCEMEVSPFSDGSVEFTIGESAYLIKNKGMSYM